MTKSSASPVRRSCAALALLAVALAACAGGQDRTRSIWPPPDWFLEVRLGQLCASGFTPERSFQVWSDGYALFRIAEAGEGDMPAPWPAVWSRVSAYRLQRESTRQLARLVHSTRLEDLPAELGSSDEGEGPVISVYARGFGKDQRITVRGAGDPKVSRLLHVVNAFLPKGESFALADMTGDPEDLHLSRVPAPKSSRVGSLELHEGLLAREPGGDGFLLDAFALAAAIGDRKNAERLLERIAAREGETASSRPFSLPGEPSRLTPILRALLPK